MEELFSRQEPIFGREGMERLKNSRIAVFGVGGVGGYVVESLARGGIGQLDLIDSDVVSVSNRNRQIVALQSTVGRKKVEVAKERVLDINPDVVVRTYDTFFLPENAETFDFSQYDYVVDAIDTVAGKIALVVECNRKNVPVISSMGAGNKLDPTAFFVKDLFDTAVDPLAKVMRRELKKRGVTRLKVVCSEEKPLPIVLEDGKRAPGSTSFVPPTVGLILAGEVIKDIAFCRLSQEKDQIIAENAPVLEPPKGAGKEAFVERDRTETEEDFAYEVEESLRKKFHRTLFSKFAKGIVQYNLLKPGDKVAVCISGGKDSMLMAKLFQELKRHNKYPFDLVFLTMDPGYNAENRALIEENAKKLGIPLTIYETDIFENVTHIEKSPCYLCARMRRGHLYAKAKELGCNKIALGHHYDDVIETIVMGMLYGAQIQTMMPYVKSQNFEGMELIRPMYLVREKDVKAWRDEHGLRFLQCACKFTTETDYHDLDKESASKRKKVKKLIADLAKEDPEIEQNVFRSVENVNLSTVIEYKDKEGVRHRFDEES